MKPTQDTKTIPSATIIMVREANNGLETFMVVRHHKIDFASGALVFPGGKIDDQDYEMNIHCEGLKTEDSFDPAYKETVKNVRSYPHVRSSANKALIPVHKASAFSTTLGSYSC